MSISLSPPDGNDVGITVPHVIPYIPPAPVSSLEGQPPFPTTASSPSGAVTYINSKMWRGNKLTSSPTWEAPLLPRFETFAQSPSYSAVREGQEGYCSPLSTNIAASLNNNEEEIINHTTSYICVPINNAYNSTLNDTCVGGPCPTVTGTTVAMPGIFIDKSNIASTKTLFDFLYDNQQNETEGYPLQWDTIPDDDITDVIGNNTAREITPISVETFLDFYCFDSIAEEGYVNKTISDSGVKIFSFPTPTPGGTTFIVENYGQLGLEVTGVVGSSYSIQLPPDDMFAPGARTPRGSILYGEGTILYDSFGGINLSKFTGAIRTTQGRVLFSNPLYRYKHVGKNAVSIGSLDHLKTLRKFDPTFLGLANNLRLDINPRSPQFESQGYGFASWDDPGSGRAIVSESFDNEYFATGSLNLVQPEFSFPTPSLPEFREIRKSFIPYINDVPSTRNIFNKNVHRGIAALLKIIQDTRGDYNPHFFYDISLDNMEQSLRPDINKLINNLPDKFGNPINKNLFLQGFVNLLLLGRVDEFNATYLRDYYEKNSTIDEVKKLRGYSKVRGETTPSIGSTGIGQTVEEIRAQRRATVVPPTPPPEAQFMEEDIVAYANLNNKSLDFRKYKGTSVSDSVLVDKMKRRWIAPQDIKVNLPVLFPSTKVGYIYISNDKAIAFSGPTGTLKVPFDKEYQIFFNKTDGTAAFTLELSYDDIQYCFALDRQEEVRVLQAGTTENSMRMEVTTPSSIYEFTADLSSTLSSVYYLKFDPDTIADLPPDLDEDYLRQTKVTYNVCSFGDVSALAAEYPWPNQSLYIYYDDPILELLIQEGQANVYINTFSTDFLGYPRVRFPRWIPPIIYVIPTNQTKYIPFYGQSLLSDLNDDANKLNRSLEFVSHFDNSISPIELDTPPMLIQDASGGANYRLATEGSSWAGASTYYTGGVQPDSRSTPPLRAAYEAITNINNNFIIVDGLTEYDIWSRIGAKAYYGLKNSTVTVTPIKQLLNGSTEAMGNAATGVRIYKNSIDQNIVAASGAAYFNRSRIIRPKTDPPDIDTAPYLREVYVNPGTTVGGGTSPNSPGAPASDTPSREDWA